MKKSTLFLFGSMILMSWITSSAQPYFRKDSLEFYSDTLFVTANKSERQIKNISVPISIINGKNIIQSGNTRLSDVLREQTGITLTSGFGAGVQLQGLNPDYTIILIDGEPLIGRTAGVLDLNRIAVGNIKKIEIVKGPSSSLYGSEAMAGVINIITTTPKKSEFDMSARYGSFNTSDINTKISIGQDPITGVIDASGDYRSGFRKKANESVQSLSLIHI